MNKKKPNIRALLSLIDEVGGQVKLAEKLTEKGYPIGQSAIALWIRRGKVSKLFAMHIENVFGHPTKHQLCPEYYKKEVEKVAQPVRKHRQVAQ
jgi:arginine repressor